MSVDRQHPTNDGQHDDPVQALTEDELSQLRVALKRDGVGPTARALGCSREPLCRAAAGLKIQRGTRLAISYGLARRSLAAQGPDVEGPRG